MFRIIIIYLLTIAVCNANLFNVLNSAPQSARYREVKTNTYAWSTSDSNETWFTGWQFTNQWDFFVTNATFATTLTNFDCRAGSDTNGAYFDGLTELENRGRINYALKFPGNNEYIRMVLDETINVEDWKLVSLIKLNTNGFLDVLNNKSDVAHFLRFRDYKMSVVIYSSNILYPTILPVDTWLEVKTIRTGTNLLLYAKNVDNGNVYINNNMFVTNASASVSTFGIGGGGYPGRTLDGSMLSLTFNTNINITAISSGSKCYSQRTPAPSNCMWENITSAYLENYIAGEFGIERVDE